MLGGYKTYQFYDSVSLVRLCSPTLNVEKASEAISNVDTSTYLKKLKKSSEQSIILASASYLAHSLSIVPQLSAISWCSYLQTQHTQKNDQQVNK